MLLFGCISRYLLSFRLRNTLSKSVIISSPNELIEFDNNKSIEIQSVDKLTDNTALLTYKPKEEFIIEHDTSNIVISLWTTSAARIRLLKAMQKVAGRFDCNLLYGDTDSILFSYPKNMECPLQTGPHLGDLAREYAGSEIKEYVGGACKALIYVNKPSKLNCNICKLIFAHHKIIFFSSNRII
uniref:DNA-directed DNA polymerase n=1 Tax=Meloidogyne incognita TaxID=6306 RepID=A0A914MY59_MELIC